MIESNSPGNFSKIFNFDNLTSTEIVQKFEDSRKSSFESFKSFETKRRQSFTLYKDICDNLLGVLETIYTNSSERLFQVYRFFDQLRFGFRTDSHQFSEIESFKFQRSKKSKNSKREVNENSDLFDLVSNFKDEFNELSQNFEKFQKETNEYSASSILKGKLKPYQEKVQSLLMQVRSQRGKVERVSNDLIKESHNVHLIFLWNIENSFFGPKNQSENGKEETSQKSKRNTFELVSNYFNKSQQCFAVLKQYALLILSVFEAVKDAERERIFAIKAAMEHFIVGLSALFGKNNSFFPASIYLTENLDVDRITEFEFEVSALLLPAEIDFIYKKTNMKELNFDTLKYFFENTKMDSCHEVLNLLIVDKFFCLLVEEGSPPSQSTIFVTTENNLVIYKILTSKKEFEFVDSLFVEQCKIKKNANNESFSILSEEKRFIWDKKKTFSFVYDEESFRQINEYLETAHLIYDAFRSKKVFQVKSEKRIKMEEFFKIENLKRDAEGFNLTAKMTIPVNVEASSEDTDNKEKSSNDSEKNQESAHEVIFKEKEESK